MGRRMIYHLVLAIILAIAYYMFIESASLVDGALFAIIYLVFSIIFDFILEKIRSKKNQTQIVCADHEKVKALIEAVGGVGNIVQTDSESSRVKVQIDDVDLIDQDKLTALSLDGAYLAGNQLQMTIGVSSDDFARQIREVVG